MEIDANKVINEYAKIVMELQHQIVLLKLSNEQLKEELQMKGNEN